MGFVCPKNGCSDEFDSSRGMKCHHYHKHGEKLGLVKVNCHHCGDEFKKQQSEVKRNDRQFCDNSCFGKWQSEYQKGSNNGRWDGGKKQKHTCEFCGDSYTNYMSKNETRFCSLECYSKWMSENLVGEKSNAWRGGYENYYGPSWERSRKEALSSSEYSCEKCGLLNEEHKQQFNEELHVHHIKKFRKFGLKNHKKANEQSNLMVVCRDCHYKVET